MIILISVNVSLMSALAGKVSFGNPMWEYLVYQYFLINHALSQVSGKEHFFINELRKENFIMCQYPPTKSKGLVGACEKS